MTDNRVSDELLTLGDLRKANVARQEFWGGSDNWTLADWSNALAGEVGEACNVVKKLRRPQLGTIGNTADAEDYLAQLESELGDVLIYLDLLARAAGLDLATCVMRAFNEKSDKLKMPIRLQPSLCQELSERRSQEAGGWRLVPVEPTREQIEAGLSMLMELLGDSSVIIRDPLLCYRAMIQAAPAPPREAANPSSNGGGVRWGK